MRSDDRSSWAIAYEKFYDSIVRNLKSRGAHDTESGEFFHEALEHVIFQIKKGRIDCNITPDSKIGGLIYVIAFRKYLRWRKKTEGQIQTISLEYLQENGYEPEWENLIEEIETRDLLLSKAEILLTSLHKNDQKLISLRLFENKSYNEIASKMESSSNGAEPNEANVKTAFHRAIVKLRKKFFDNSSSKII
jgi:DNA-directed RNA polymerase specialized sigma24 family protein